MWLELCRVQTGMEKVFFSVGPEIGKFTPRRKEVCISLQSSAFSPYSALLCAVIQFFFFLNFFLTLCSLVFSLHVCLCRQV